MKTINFQELKITQEWVVEIFDKSDKKFNVLGKVFTQYKMKLDNDHLENIWNLLNYGPANLEPDVICDNDIPYNDMKVYSTDETDNQKIFYIPFTYGQNHPYCNDDIFIRTHRDPMKGYYIYNIKGAPDEWKYETRMRVLNYLRNKKL